MFRKSVSFFILVALLWVLLWTLIPDVTPDNFTVSDFFRGFPLLFSFLAFGFALLMLTIRYKGIDIVSRLFPQTGLMMWLVKNAYQFSQPKTIVHCQTDRSLNGNKLMIKTKQINHEVILDSSHIETIDLGFLTQNPIFNWKNKSGQQISQKLIIKKHLKNIGKNLQVDVQVNNNSLSFKIN